MLRCVPFHFTEYKIDTTGGVSTHVRQICKRAQELGTYSPNAGCRAGVVLARVCENKI